MELTKSAKSSAFLKAIFYQSFFFKDYFSIQSFTSPFQDYIFLTFLSWKRDRALSSPVTMELTIEARRHK
jgi:hypothetical protein